MNTPQKDVFDYSIKTIVDGNVIIRYSNYS